MYTVLSYTTGVAMKSFLVPVPPGSYTPFLGLQSHFTPVTIADVTDAFCWLHGDGATATRGIFPYDWNLIAASVVRDGPLAGGKQGHGGDERGAHLVRQGVEEHFYDLAVRPRALLGKYVPRIGMSPSGEIVDWGPAGVYSWAL
jgi:hypothetical protein